mmetsp:Transcript_83915/g.166556  ORF Transcript_83915/g.166556 Transcript_83915/m.166556 type:complete len:183 (-) Transcript_83915:502-1050(-)
MLVPSQDGCNQLVDDGGEATLLVHRGKEFEGKLANDGSQPDPPSTDNPELKCILQLIKDSIQVDKTRYTRMAAKLKEVSEECRHSLPDGNMRATDVIIGGKRTLVCGDGDMSKRCAFPLSGAGARIMDTEIDSICALPACMEGLHVVTTETAAGEIGISTPATGNIGRFNNEIDMAGLVKQR